VEGTVINVDDECMEAAARSNTMASVHTPCGSINGQSRTAAFQKNPRSTLLNVSGLQESASGAIANSVNTESIARQCSEDINNQATHVKCHVNPSGFGLPNTFQACYLDRSEADFSIELLENRQPSGSYNFFLSSTFKVV
jgi:hypothetical protein